MDAASELSTDKSGSASIHRSTSPIPSTAVRFNEPIHAVIVQRLGSEYLPSTHLLQNSFNLSIVTCF